VKMKEELEYKWTDFRDGYIIPEPGTSRAYHTGDWRSQRPIFDHERCIKCGVCWIYCPDAAIRFDAEGYAEADLDYCKGCGICSRECLPAAISMADEEE
jgi:pyruvate ferredoxin oxidoreductase delta subunit